jgi:hypothetical protein
MNSFRRIVYCLYSLPAVIYSEKLLLYLYNL